MHPVANHLIQLQELTLVREEQLVAAGLNHLEQLNEAIETMTAGLPDGVRVMFGKLTTKDRNVIVPVTDGLCAGCRVQLPISLVQQVRLGTALQNCPNCARYLYMPESGVRNTRRRPGRFEPQKPGIARFSAPSLMIPSMAAKDRDGAIGELARRLADEGFVDKAESLAEGALRREALFPTAVEHGLAFPHVRGVEGGALTLAVGKSVKGIRFDGHSNERSRIFFFMVIPTSASSFYLKLLAGLTETFMDDAARQALLDAQDGMEMWKTLVKVTRKLIK